jgi:hypothetical protein
MECKRNRPALFAFNAKREAGIVANPFWMAGESGTLRKERTSPISA